MPRGCKGGEMRKGKRGECQWAKLKTIYAPSQVGEGKLEGRGGGRASICNGEVMYEEEERLRVTKQ